MSGEPSSSSLLSSNNNNNSKPLIVSSLHNTTTNNNNKSGASNSNSSSSSSSPKAAATPTTAAAAANDNGSNTKEQTENETDPQGKHRMSATALFWNRARQWKGASTFMTAQVQVAVVLVIAYAGNNWPETYPRNDNHSYYMFWFMNAALLVVALATLQHVPGRDGTVQLLSRPQTEEWKGWMQWAFIMYHYYRAYNVYNTIRCFVSAYVWMTGFGNFLYFNKKQDFSIERALSMWLRINYFPILLSVFVGVPIELLYIVPLHTTAFFITMATCYLAFLLKGVVPTWSADSRNVAAIATCFMVHIVFYETPLVNFLKLFGKDNEILFRFQSDKYSAVLGILSGYGWAVAQRFITWTHLPMPVAAAQTTDESGSHKSGFLPSGVALYSPDQIMAARGQRIFGVVMIAFWWIFFGHINDKYTYNPMHPYIFWMPLVGWLALRNGSKYLTELHSTALEFFGKITLETYVLQFHVFMCRNVQHIPVVIPGSGKDGPAVLKFLNMLVTGVLFVALAYWARQITVTTQSTVTDLLILLRKGPAPTHNNATMVNGGNAAAAAAAEIVSLTRAVDGDDDAEATNNDESGTPSKSSALLLQTKESGDA